LHLCPLLGRHRVHHRLHRGHALRHLLQQLLERLRVLWEEVAELLHELLETGIFAALVTLDHLVERRHHVLHALHGLGRHVLHGRRHLIDALLHELLAQSVHQLLEALRGLCALEVVGRQLAHLAGEVVGQHVETEVAVGPPRRGRLRAAFVTTALGLAGGVLDGVTLFVDDVVELVGDLLVDAAEVEAVERLLALLAQLLHEIAQALHLLAIAVAACPAA